MNKTMRPLIDRLRDCAGAWADFDYEADAAVCYEAADRIRELEELTDWVCIYCHQRNIGGTQCCPDWDGTTVNSHILELENDLAERIEWCAEIDALAVKQKAQLEAVRELCTLYFEGCDSITFDDAMLKIRAAIGESNQGATKEK